MKWWHVNELYHPPDTPILGQAGADVQRTGREDASSGLADAGCYTTMESPNIGDSRMNILREFRDFAVRGNMVDMAVGIIIGGAFGTIVASLVKDVIMPPIGMLLGGVDFSDIKVPLRAAADGRDAVTMNIGVFLNNVISFLIVAFAVFMLVKTVNEIRRRFETENKAPPSPPPSEVYLREIRDALVKK